MTGPAVERPLAELQTPQGCVPLPLDWPWSGAAGDWQVQACRFDERQLREDDFARLGLSAPRARAKRQMEFLAGRYCAAVVLRGLGCALLPVRGADGCPQWPPGYCGSLSHSHGVAVAIAGRQHHWRSLGLDLETCLSASRAARLSGAILTPAEQQRLQAMPAEQRAAQVSLCFSLKESLFKALYPLTGVRFYFADAEVLQAAAGEAQLRLLKDLSPDWRKGTLLRGHYMHLGEQLLSLVAIDHA